MNNPYSPPNAALNDDGMIEEFYQPSLFSLKGRIGRWRYLGYIGILTFLIYFVVGLSAALVIPAIQKSQGNPPMMMSIALVVIFYLPFIAMHLIFARRRFHDLDLSGWLSALVLIPLLNLLVWLYLIFAPGTRGRNSYGAQPGPNSIWLIIFGVLLPAVLVGVLAVTSINAYQDYVHRAKQLRESQRSSQQRPDALAPQ